MGLISEFKEFALKGSVVDLAVGVIIGAAFGGVVNSVVKDVMMPPLGLLMGGVDFSQQKLILRHATTQPVVAETAINYGVFINTLINFLIVAIAIFIVIKLMNTAKRQPPPADPTTKECPRCCSTIPIKATRCPNCTSDLPAVA
jgi:large conductance mechanosensitive channel